MEKKLEIGYLHVDSLDFLAADDRALVAEAQKAVGKAYAEYSKFRVGAAARLRSGAVLHGANSESEVFPSGICAERSLLYYAEANFPNDPVEALAIASDPSERECYPCGGCRPGDSRRPTPSGNADTDNHERRRYSLRGR